MISNNPCGNRDTLPFIFEKLFY